MMKIEKFVDLISADFFTGVPDSQLKSLCDYLIDRYGIDCQHHLIAANEGNCTAIAAGYHLATGKVPVVYMQNSGEGNVINPVASLLNDEVYGIPCIFVVGWRGEPDVHDEPQHIYQGKVTLKLLEDMSISYFVVDKDTTEAKIAEQLKVWQPLLAAGKQVAFVVKKGGLTYDKKVTYTNANKLSREEVLRHVVKVSGTDPIVSTTGKLSRELFEIREANHEGHGYDFLTVGSMGHSSSIALGIALNQPNNKIWCLDGDGAVLMHMGAMAVIGATKQKNLIHVVINNGAHESVGGMPTVAEKINLPQVAVACGYDHAVRVDSLEKLDQELAQAKQRNQLSLIEIACSIGSRADLGRPTTTAKDNKLNFMQNLKAK